MRRRQEEHREGRAPQGCDLADGQPLHDGVRRVAALSSLARAEGACTRAACGATARAARHGLPRKRVWFSRQQRASSLCDGQVLRRGSSYRHREGGAATHWIQGRRALRPSRRRCDARDAEPLPPQEGSLCQVQAAHLRQPERLPPDSYAPSSAQFECATHARPFHADQTSAASAPHSASAPPTTTCREKPT